MREFRKTRIQREVSELLADVDTWNGGAGSPSDLTLRQIGVAFFSLIIGVVLGQSVALMAVKNKSSEGFQFKPASHLQRQQPSNGTEVSGDLYPELPEIKLIYISSEHFSSTDSKQRI